jgi:membrane-bound lytic murein transglycosylase A
MGMPAEPRLHPLDWRSLQGWKDDEVAEAWPALCASTTAIAHGRKELRLARTAPRAFRDVAEAAAADPDCHDVRAFLEHWFVPCRIETDGVTGGPAGFLTGYYEPQIEGSREASPDFRAPVLARPSDLDRHSGPYPDRGAIRHGEIRDRTRPVVWLRDEVEVFFAQVQGSARVALPDGKILRLVYDGRNGQPYTSIGRILIERGEIVPEDMSLATIKAWLRSHGADRGGPADAIMDQNKSYVFFRAEAADASEDHGPIGGQGLPLATLRSLAVDRSLWSYGLPFWIDATIPWRGPAEPFRRLMIAQDTGSAIVGPARADLYFGSGPEAGQRASLVRHPADMVVLMPKGHFA